MNKQLPARQHIRKLILITSFLSLPISMNFLSASLIIDNTARGILSGGALMFGLFFLISLFLGRAGYLKSSLRTLNTSYTGRLWKPARRMLFIMFSAPKKEVYK